MHASVYFRMMDYNVYKALVEFNIYVGIMYVAGVDIDLMFQVRVYKHPSNMIQQGAILVTIEA